jgi:hypothetical protein
MQFESIIETLNLEVMKNFSLKWGSLFLAIGLCLISYNTFSQDIQLDKKEKKEARKAEALANFEFLNTLIMNRNFVIKADVLENKYGDRINVLPGLNFIKVDSTNAVLQTGSSTGTGYNGVGGVTAEGRINHWDVVRNYKSLSYYLHFNVETSIGVYDVSMMLGSGDNVRATITGLTPGELVYDGHIETLYRSGIYKGQNSYY